MAFLKVRRAKDSLSLSTSSSHNLHPPFSAITYHLHLNHFPLARFHRLLAKKHSGHKKCERIGNEATAVESGGRGQGTSKWSQMGRIDKRQIHQKQPPLASAPLSTACFSAAAQSFLFQPPHFLSILHFPSFLCPIFLHYLTWSEAMYGHTGLGQRAVFSLKSRLSRAECPMALFHL